MCASNPASTGCARTAFFALLLCFTPSRPDDTSAVSAGDYDFDMAGYEQSPFESNLAVDMTPGLLAPDYSAAAGRLRYPDVSVRLLDIYGLRGEAGAGYRKKWFAAGLSGQAGLNWSRTEDSLSLRATLIEAFVKASAGPSLTLSVGKRAVKWGKGYVYSPVSFAGRRKDVSDIEASLEGYWMAGAEYVRAIGGPLESFAATLVVLPVYDEINRGLAGDRTVSAAAQFYALVVNTDIDLYGLVNSGRDYSLGFDLSRNILPNLELHADFAWVSEAARAVFDDDFNHTVTRGPGAELLAGARLLTPFNATIIFEYLHRGRGYASDETARYRSALDTAASLAAENQLARGIASVSARYYSGQFTMRNYLYAKISQPDFLRIVYFNPALYVLFNCDDLSALAGVELAYNRFAHLSMLLRYIANIGSGSSEFGTKPLDQRVEARLRFMW